MKIEKLLGPIPANYTPMLPDGTVNYDLIEDYYAFLIPYRITILILLLTTDLNLLH
jgi:dihydrodipicolinate synthase/N-acetylneuraminate lyase